MQFILLVIQFSLVLVAAEKSKTPRGSRFPELLPEVWFNPEDADADETPRLQEILDFTTARSKDANPQLYEFDTTIAAEWQPI